MEGEGRVPPSVHQDVFLRKTAGERDVYTGSERTRGPAQWAGQSPPSALGLLSHAPEGSAALTGDGECWGLGGRTACCKAPVPNRLRRLSSVRTCQIKQQLSQDSKQA